MLYVLDELGITVEKKRQYFWVNIPREEKPIKVFICDVEALNVDADENEVAALIAIIKMKTDQINSDERYCHEISCVYDPRFKEVLAARLLFVPMEAVIKRVYSMKYFDLQDYFLKGLEPPEEK